MEPNQRYDFCPRTNSEGKQFPLNLVSHKAPTIIGRVFKDITRTCGDGFWGFAAKASLIFVSIISIVPILIFGIDYLVNSKTMSKDLQLKEFEDQLKKGPKYPEVKGKAKAYGLFICHLHETKLDKDFFLAKIEDAGIDDTIKKYVKKIIDDLYPDYKKTFG